MAVAIPKRMAHIWIGDLNPPIEWMQSWRDHHPGWDYTLYDNDYLTSRRWRSQALIARYFKRRAFSGVSDLMRYEILLEHGGVIPEADAFCLRPTDELWTKPTLYGVWEHEDYRPGFISPFIASEPNNSFLEFVVTRINKRWTPESLRPPVKSVGNRFLARLYAAFKPDIEMLPSTTFNQLHFKDREAGITELKPGAYCEQMWGTTKGLYNFEDDAKRRSIYETVLKKLYSYL